MTTNEIIWWLEWLERKGVFRAILAIVAFFGVMCGFSMLALWLLFRHH